MAVLPSSPSQSWAKALSSVQTQMLPLRHHDLPGETEGESWRKEEQSGRLPGNGSTEVAPTVSVRGCVASGMEAVWQQGAPGDRSAATSAPRPLPPWGESLSWVQGPQASIM